MTTLVVAVAAVAAAASGPIYLEASNRQVLESTVAGASLPDRGITLTAPLSVTPMASEAPVLRLQRAMSELKAEGLSSAFPTGIQNVQVAGSLPGNAAEPDGYSVELAARDGVCSHLAIAAGSCPANVNEALVSDRSAAQLGAKAGDGLVFKLAGQPALRLTVAGIYRPGNSGDGYWWGLQFFGFARSEPTTNGGSTPFYLDSVFVTSATVAQLPANRAAPDVTEELPLALSAVDQDNFEALRQKLLQYSARIAENYNVEFGSRLPELLSGVSSQERQMATIVAVVVVQAELVVLFMLYSLAAGTADAREPEAALAKLRGLGIQALVATVLMEPVALATAALPIGIGLAWTIARLAFPPNLPVAITALAVGAGGLGYLAAAAGTALAMRRLLVRPLAEQIQRNARPRTGRWSLALDVAAVALAGAGLLELSAVGVLKGGQRDPLAMLAPGLLAAATGVICVRSVPLMCRLGTRFTRDSRFLASFLAIRLAGRRPQSLRPAIAITTALALATFAVAAWIVSDRNRGIEATFSIGADRVVTVDVPETVDFQAAVRAADSSDRQAMAVERYDSAEGKLIAVDSSRLAQVAAWPVGLTPGGATAAARWLSPPRPQPILLSGTAIRLTADEDLAIKPQPELELTVADRQGGAHSVALGSLVAGTHAYVAPLPPACSRSCRLVRLATIWNPTPPPGVPPHLFHRTATLDLRLTGLETQATGGAGWAALDPSWTDPHRWAPSTLAVSVDRAPVPPGLHLTFDEDNRLVPPPSVQAADAVRAIPAIVTRDVAAIDSHGSDTEITVKGLDDQAFTVNGHLQARALPRVGSGTLVDLSAAENAMSGSAASGLVREVWLAPGAPVSILDRLKEQGLTVKEVESAAAAKSRLDQSGLALAYRFFLSESLLVVLTVLGAVLFNVASRWRRAAWTYAVLKLIGLREPVLVRALLAEQLIGAGAALALGIAAGVASAALALPSVPELPDSALPVPLQFTVPAIPLIAMAVGLAALLLLVMLVSALMLARTSTPGRIRTTI